MNANEAIEVIVTIGKAMHDKYVELGKTSAEWPADLGEQLATGMWARQKFFSGKHRRADIDQAAEIVRGEIMAGRLPTAH
jgi:hypothetical protein